MRRFKVGDAFRLDDGSLIVVHTTWGTGRNCGVFYRVFRDGVRVWPDGSDSERGLTRDLARHRAVDVEGAHCRVCGCTDGDCRYCVARTGHPCSWIEADLCSACSAPAAESEA